MTVDFVIITALPEERDAMLAHLPGWTKLEKDGADIHTYYEASVTTRRRDGATYRLIVSSLVEYGPVNAATKAAAVVNRWQPRCVLLVGIAGGSAKHVALGDVVVAKHLADYTLGRVEADGRRVRWTAHQPDSSLLDSAHNLGLAWRGRIRQSRPEAGTPETRFGVVASGGDVIAFEDLLREYEEPWGKLLGVEMEAAGAASALHQTTTRPGFLMVRGISDLADADKNAHATKRWRPYACDVAAAFAAELLHEGPLPPAEAPPRNPR